MRMHLHSSGLIESRMELRMCAAFKDAMRTNASGTD